jgi:hypothetical protein
MTEAERVKTELARKLCEYYDDGAITQYELYMRARERYCWMYLPEAHKTEYEKWDKEHPAGECKTFSIVCDAGGRDALLRKTS